MAGGLLQLVAFGAQDTYIVGNPQITHFKSSFNRHTNFSIETIEIPFDTSVEFGKKAEITIPRKGDLIKRTYLKVILDKVIPSNNSKFAWTHFIGASMLDFYEIEIGGSRIDKQYGIIYYTDRHS